MYRVVVGLAIVLWSSSVLADEATAKKKFAQGESAYNLGEFDKAVELFKEAYAEWPDPAFLFNIGQTYRQAGNCKEAMFFYKRYLALKQNDTKKPLKPEVKAEVEKRIVELDECIKRDLASKPPDQLDSGTTGTSSTTTTSGTPGNDTTTTPTNASTTTAQLDNNQTDEGEEDEGEEEEPTEPAAMQPSLISVRINAGAGKLTAGDLDTPIQFAAAIAGGYPLSINEQLQIELGAALSFTPVPYTTTSGEHGSGALIGVIANVAPSYTIIPKLAARLDVGAGVLVFSGLGQDGNPFTAMGVAATGPLSTLHVRAAVSADYAVTPNLVLTATPLAFGYSPAPSGFDDSISSLTTLSFLAGVSYRR
jgi:hypothetical protein